MNNENLIPFNQLTEDEQREIAKKGGIASGKVRRQKRDLKEILHHLLEMSVGSFDTTFFSHDEIAEEDRTNYTKIALSLIQKAQKGDINAIKYIFKITENNE